MTPEVEAAYATCRMIARREAKNFYYAFVALPAAKRNAICAVYAFMRRADDLSDDESLPLEARRAMLQDWLQGWHDALAGKPTQDPVFLALLDARSRFSIPAKLLDQLVEGTATDLEAKPSPGAAGVKTYETFADLYRYCYLVASVVGLVCIRIFGYSDPHAELLAENTGVAFQLTNILRDVREDAARGRIYLPLEDLERSGVGTGEIAHLTGAQPLTAAQRRVLEIQAERADELYRSASGLLPLISADSRPALWVLVTIYHRLLERIRGRNYDVFSQRISVPTYEKLTILGQGILKTLLVRLRPAAS